MARAPKKQRPRSLTTSGKPPGLWTTHYRAEFVAVARRMALSGAPYEVIGAALGDGVSRDAVAKWIKKYPDFAKAIREGHEQARGVVAERLYERAQGAKQVQRRSVVTKSGKRLVEETVTELPGDVRAMTAFLGAHDPNTWREQRGGGVNVKVGVQNNVGGGDDEQMTRGQERLPGETWNTYYERTRREQAAVRDGLVNTVLDRLTAMRARVVSGAEDVDEALADVDLPNDVKLDIAAHVAELRAKWEVDRRAAEQAGQPVAYHDLQSAAAEQDDYGTPLTPAPPPPRPRGPHAISFVTCTK